MPPSDAGQLLGSLGKRFHQVRDVRDSGEGAFRQGAIRQRDLDHVYSSTFLALTSAFEVFQEELFFSCVLGKSEIRRVKSKVDFSSRAELEQLAQFAEGRTLLSWSRMRDNIRRAELFLHAGRPFSRLKRRQRDLDVLHTGTVVRNAIAHESRQARTRFRELALGALPPSRRVPAGFLRQEVGEITQHENLTLEYERLAHALAARTDRTAWRLLRDEAPYRSGERVRRGTYECKSCHKRVRHRSRQLRLPQCPGCHPGPCPMCSASPKSSFLRVFL